MIRTCSRACLFCLIALQAFFSVQALRAAEPTAAVPITLDNVVDPGPNQQDEPLAESFSLDQAAAFLDSAALQWQKQRKCMTCHTNYLYLYARPCITSGVAAHQEVRKFAEELVTERWQNVGPRWDAEVVATAAALAFNDAATTGKLHPTTRVALDRMWTVQRADGGWSWLNCDWPPMESDDHYGVTLAAIALGVAPDDYAKSELAQAGLKKIRAYLAANAAPTLHHTAMTLWAASYTPDLMPAVEKETAIKQLRALQKADGGWALATLGNWKRADDKEQDLETSDGYGTGFVLYVLRRSGVPATDPALVRGIAWLKQHQRASGRWFTRSLHKDNKHFITHAGTAMAVMALGECE